MRRKRICQECGRRFVTMEHIEALNVRVVKSDETRQPFDREKIRRGIERACSKRSVPSEKIETTVQQIEAAIYSEFDFEIPADKIGEVVLRFLANVDEVAYIRFASVYREFSGAKDFLRIISVLQKNQSDGGESAWTDSNPKQKRKKTKGSSSDTKSSAPLVKEKFKKKSRAERAGS